MWTRQALAFVRLSLISNPVKILTAHVIYMVYIQDSLHNIRD